MRMSVALLQCMANAVARYFSESLDSMKCANANWLDKAVIGLALMRTKKFPLDEWDFFGGKGIIAVTMSGHLLLVYRDVFAQAMPTRFWTTLIGFAVAAVCYMMVDFATHSAVEIQEALPSRPSRWGYRIWGLLLAPFSLLIWIPLWIFAL